MIDDPPLLTVRRRFPRPSAETARRLRRRADRPRRRRDGRARRARPPHQAGRPMRRPSAARRSPARRGRPTASPSSACSTWRSPATCPLRDQILLQHRRHRRSPDGHDEELRRRRLRDRRAGARYAGHPRRRAAVLRRRRHAELAGEDRARDGRLPARSSAASRSRPATSWLPTRTASWSCPTRGSARRSSGSPTCARWRPTLRRK